MSYFVLWNLTNEINCRYLECSSFSDYFVAIVLIYILGIISFTSGKYMRTLIRRFTETESNTLKFYQVYSFVKLYDMTLSKYAIDYRQLPIDKSLAYSQMWIDIRVNDNNAHYYQQLYRQWVMQAICEGLLFSFTLAFITSLIVLIYDGCTFNIFNILYALAAVFSIVSIFACIREARRYAENQIKEVIISYAMLHGFINRDN